ncbi:MAG: IS66 family insertion sequence element accessory protein TnpB [Pseudomonadota bacterium]
MTQTPRRTPEQWQSLVDQWQDSGQSMAWFCEDHDIGYASFCHWRKRLAEEGAPTKRAVSFIALGALSSFGAQHRWNIVLSLGNGVELRLSQG